MESHILFKILKSNYFFVHEFENEFYPIVNIHYRAARGKEKKGSDDSLNQNRSPQSCIRFGREFPSAFDNLSIQNPQNGRRTSSK